MKGIFSGVLATAVAFSLCANVYSCMDLDEIDSVPIMPELEKTVSHVLVGRLNEYKSVEGVRGRYQAEIVVRRVEKGTGIVPGQAVRIRFTSPLTLEQLQIPRPSLGCGNDTSVPIPGDDLRVYTLRDDDSNYVADYPKCFVAPHRRTETMNLENVNEIAEPWNPLVLGMWLTAASSSGLAFAVYRRKSSRLTITPQASMDAKVALPQPHYPGESADSNLLCKTSHV